MRCYLFLLALPLAFCQRGKPEETPLVAQPKTATEQSPLVRELERFAAIPLQVDLSFLAPSERAALAKLAELAPVLDRIYLRQVYQGNQALRQEIASSGRPDRQELLAMFDLHFGPWNTLDANKPFYGSLERPKGAGVYPQDLSQAEFLAWLEKHPDQEEQLKSPYSVVRRNEQGLVAIPYRQEYGEDLERAALIMEEAAQLSADAKLKHFLTLRAKAFRTDDYFESEMAWMDLDGQIEVAVGPYEVYTDSLMELKTFYEMFLTVRNPEESARLDRFKGLLPEFEANLPIPDEHKNFRRGTSSPLAVVDQVLGAGECRPGVQTIAFNLPNDERVREAKGSKKVLLRNVMAAKFHAILKPMASEVLPPEQAELVDFESFFLEVLFHELAHGLGPGTIRVGDRETTVSAMLAEHYSSLEEGKADIMGLYNLLYLLNRQELPETNRDRLLCTYFTGLFRSMRFGVHEAHGAGAAFQFSFLKEQGAFTSEENGTFRLNMDRFPAAIAALVQRVCLIQAKGDVEGAARFLASYAVLLPEVEAVTAKFQDLPVDIRPQYPQL
jgi:hypothetical protein